MFSPAHPSLATISAFDIEELLSQPDEATKPAVACVFFFFFFFFLFFVLEVRAVRSDDTYQPGGVAGPVLKVPVVRADRR
jgi:hypothetical protein